MPVLADSGGEPDRAASWVCHQDNNVIVGAVQPSHKTICKVSQQGHEGSEAQIAEEFTCTSAPWLS